jgi:hypothetical protein
MADGKSCNQDQHLFPFSQRIDCTQNKDKQDMVISLQIGNVLDAQAKIEFK